VAVKAAAAKKALFHTPLHPVKKMEAGDSMPHVRGLRGFLDIAARRGVVSHMIRRGYSFKEDS
jgi:hypothetical protein